MEGDIRFSIPEILAKIRQEYTADSVVLLNLTIYEKPFEDGNNVGEVEVSYAVSTPTGGFTNHAIWGLYKNGSIACFMD